MPVWFDDDSLRGQKLNNGHHVFKNIASLRLSVNIITVFTLSFLSGVLEIVHQVLELRSYGMINLILLFQI